MDFASAVTISLKRRTDTLMRRLVKVCVFRMLDRRCVLCVGSFMFLFCLVFAMSLCASVYMCFVVTCWERADLLALVCVVYCEFVTFPLVSWVRCGT